VGYAETVYGIDDPVDCYFNKEKNQTAVENLNKRFHKDFYVVSIAMITFSILCFIYLFYLLIAKFSKFTK
jgi:uncharacterized membrane protein YukC